MFVNLDAVDFLMVASEGIYEVYDDMASEGIYEVDDDEDFFSCTMFVHHGIHFVHT